MTDKDQRTQSCTPSITRGEPAVARDWQALRQRAEAHLPKALSPSDIESLSPDAARQVVHELHVHQIELEMQNEELRESQAALDEVRARYFDLYDLAPVGYCTVSEHGLIVQSNLTAANLLGTTRSTLVKQALSRFIHRDDEDSYYLLRQRLVASGAPQSCELRMMKNDGTQLWVQLAATVAQDAQGAFELRAMLSDINERKLAEQALHDSGERYRKLFDSIDEGFCIIELIFDADGKPVDYRFLEVNPSFEKHSGFHEATGKRIRELEPNVKENWLEAYGKVAVTGEPIRFADQTKERGGRWMEVYAFRIGGHESRKVALLFRDCSKRKRAELELTEAKRTAEAANLAKSEFLSNMSHELRSPLNAILGFAQLMESSTPPPLPEQKRNLAQILKAGWYLLALINEILDLATIESGKMLLELERVSLTQVLHECTAMLDMQAQQKGITVALSGLDVPRFIKADYTRVKQVFLNLLSNAIKYNKAGGAVTVACTARHAARIRISVRDTGMGLAAAQLAHLFEPFNRLGQETGKEDGTGIGLVVSKRLIELMNGAIGVESTLGEGSVFWVELDLTAEPEFAALTTAASPAQRDAQLDAQLDTLLYVEDNAANLKLIETLVARRTDLCLVTATDGSQGIEIARTILPRVILLDINLPGVSGQEVQRILAEDPATAHIPVIALSANAMPRDIERALTAGFFRYLTKPVKIDEVMETLDLALQVSRDGSRLRH